MWKKNTGGACDRQVCRSTPFNSHSFHVWCYLCLGKGEWLLTELGVILVCMGITPIRNALLRIRDVAQWSRPAGGPGFGPHYVSPISYNNPKGEKVKEKVWCYTSVISIFERLNKKILSLWPVYVKIVRCSLKIKQTKVCSFDLSHPAPWTDLEEAFLSIAPLRKDLCIAWACLELCIPSVLSHQPPKCWAYRRVSCITMPLWSKSFYSCLFFFALWQVLVS